MFGGQFNFSIPKRNELAPLKQHFFLRDFQMIDARLPHFMTNLMLNRTLSS